MNRAMVEKELKEVYVTFNGWMPVLQCEKCNRRWEPFQFAGDESAPTVKLDYWKCPNGCNSLLDASDALKTAIPRYVEVKDNPGMIFGDEDLPDFERYVLSMDVTELADRSSW